jgi:hypothetical protein
MENTRMGEGERGRQREAEVTVCLNRVTPVKNEK